MVIWSVLERVRRTLDRLVELSEASGFLNLIKLLVYACLSSYMSWGVMGNEDLGLIVDNVGIEYWGDKTSLL